MTDKGVGIGNTCANMKRTTHTSDASPIVHRRLDIGSLSLTVLFYPAYMAVALLISSLIACCYAGWNSVNGTYHLLSATVPTAPRMVEFNASDTLDLLYTSDRQPFGGRSMASITNLLANGSQATGYLLVTNEHVFPGPTATMAVGSLGPGIEMVCNGWFVFQKVQALTLTVECQSVSGISQFVYRCTKGPCTLGQ